MSEINASNFKKEHGDLAPDLVGVTELTSPYFFVPPSGNTAERPSDCEPGTLRFNTDIGSLEVFRGNTIGWEQIQRRESQYLGGGTGSNTGTGTRGITAGGNTPSAKEEIEFVTISTFGNTQDFGDLAFAATGVCGSASATRGIFNGTGNPATNTIQFITISSTGDAVDFGDNTVGTTGYRNALASQTRSVAGGQNSSGNTMDFVTIATTGNAIDFGDLTYSISMPYAFASTTRGIFAGGNSQSTINFITIATTGNATVFGSLSAGTVACNGAVSNATRGCMKFRTGSYINTIEFLTTATLGNSVDFGDSTNNAGGNGGLASPTRGLFAGGYGSPSFRTEIAAIEIPTTGNAVDFGDMSYAADAIAGLSNGHGGL